jgi:hypothetical protein
MMLDATRHYDQPLTSERLFAWHSSLFPTGPSGVRRIRVGAWRDGTGGPMEVVSGQWARNVFISRHQPRKNWTRKWELSSIS